MRGAAVAVAVIMAGQQPAVAAVAVAGPVPFLAPVLQVPQIPEVAVGVVHLDSMVALAVPVSSSSSTLYKLIDMRFVSNNGMC
jgi:hypothetical protein